MANKVHEMQQTVRQQTERKKAKKKIYMYIYIYEKYEKSPTVCNHNATQTTNNTSLCHAE